VLSSLAAFGLAVALAYLPLAHWLGLVPMPAPVLGALALVTVTYLVAVYAVKRWFFARYQLN
jgi:P-type Mg2+ transporter